MYVINRCTRTKNGKLGTYRGYPPHHSSVNLNLLPWAQMSEMDDNDNEINGNIII